MLKRFLIATATCLALAPAAKADVINGSFEAGAGAPTASATQGDSQAIGTSNITGWTVVNNAGTTVDNGLNVLWIYNGGYGLSTPYGSRFLDLTGTSDSTPYDGVTQTITTVVGQTYAMTFDLGVSTSGGPFSGTISVDADAGSAVTAVTDDGTSGTLNGVTEWTDESVLFTATSTTTPISIIGESDTAGQFIGLDNVAVNAVTTTAVPEPLTISLFGAGLAGAAAFRRRRKIKST
jgi:Protein of unknown function (DUF642)/PEP-CTERM motif